MLLRRLAVFTCDFTFEAAAAIAGDARCNVIDGISNLVAKSLVSADVSAAVVNYRLLNTTRIYARIKLAASGELDDVARRHAEHERTSFDQGERGSQWALPLAATHRRVDNLVAASLCDN
jgi:predicted ATPase